MTYLYVCSLVNIMYSVNVNHIVWGREEYLKPVVASISFDTYRV